MLFVFYVDKENNADLERPSPLSLLAIAADPPLVSWILLHDPVGQDLTFARVTAAALWKDSNTEPPP